MRITLLDGREDPGDVVHRHDRSSDFRCDEAESKPVSELKMLVGGDAGVTDPHATSSHPLSRNP